MSVAAEIPFLPFHCPRLKGDYLKEPCTTKLAQLKALTEKFNLPFLGPLEHCRACQGKELVTREAPSPQPSPARGEEEEEMNVARGKLTEAEAKRLPPQVLAQAVPLNEGEDAPPEPAEVRAGSTRKEKTAKQVCAKHGKPIKFNRRGVSMGGCEDCRKEISACGGAAADPMVRLFKGREELRAWLEAEGHRNCRSPEQQMVYCCLLAYESAEKAAGPQTA
jgi:hypothetical protein